MRLADLCGVVVLAIALGGEAAWAQTHRWVAGATEAATEQEYETVVDPDEPLQPLPTDRASTWQSSYTTDKLAWEEWTEYEEGVFDQDWDELFRVWPSALRK